MTMDLNTRLALSLTAFEQFIGIAQAFVPISGLMLGLAADWEGTVAAFPGPVQAAFIEFDEHVQALAAELGGRREAIEALVAEFNTLYG